MSEVQRDQGDGVPEVKCHTPTTAHHVVDLGYQFRDASKTSHDHGSIHDAMDAASLCLHLRLEYVAGATVEKTLRGLVAKNSIPVKICYDNSTNAKFLPLHDFDRIFCPRSIEALAKEMFSDLGYTDQMQSSLLDEMRCRRRILATLLVMKKMSCFEGFIHTRQSDKDLPLRLPDHVGNDDALDPQPLAELNDRILFRYHQYQFLVPYLAIGMGPQCYEYVINPGSRMPWVTHEPIKKSADDATKKSTHNPTKKSTHNPTKKPDPRESRPRSVYKVRIHREHYNFSTYQDDRGNLKEPYFALKRILDGTYKGELEALLKLSCKSDRTTHLVTLLLAIDQGTEKFLLFECADGDLDKFWSTFDKSYIQTRPRAMNQRWAAFQCHGLATALMLIHGEDAMGDESEVPAAEMVHDFTPNGERDFGCHGDIKPTNILWFADRNGQENTLMIADLGSTRYHSRETRSNVTYLGGGTNRYEAPESSTRNRVSRTCDIWSLGCVFLEFCIWWLEGHKAVRTFEDNCSFTKQEWDIFHSDSYFLVSRDEKHAELKPVVHEKIDQLRQAYPEDIFSRNLLKLIKKDMIVINPESRKGIESICDVLKEIISQVE